MDEKKALREICSAFLEPAYLSVFHAPVCKKNFA